VKKSVTRSFAAALEGLRKVGFFLALVVGSAAMGLLIAWPLWFFATSARQVYTITVLVLAGGGIVYLAVRSAQRRRKSLRDAGKPGRGLLSAVLTILLVMVGISGAYLAAALFIRGLWKFGAGAVVVWAGLLWLIGWARGAVKTRKPGQVPAENGSE